MGQDPGRRNEKLNLRRSLSQILFNGQGWKTAWAWAVLWTAALRVGVGAAMALTWQVMKPYLLPQLLAVPDIYGKLPVYQTFPADALLGVWLRWDAVHHVNLALRGYFDLSEGDSVFYPAYAGLIRLLTPLSGGEPVVAALAVSTLATLVTLALLYRLTEQAYGPAAARSAVAALAVYPTAFFLIAPFTESLYLAGTLTVFWLTGKGRWAVSGLPGALASLARGPGIYTPAALAWPAWKYLREKPAFTWRKLLAVACGLGLPVIAGLAFLGWRAWAGFAPVAQVLKVYSGLVMTNPIQGLYSGLATMVTHPSFTAWLEGLSALAWITILVAMLRQARWRRVDWLIYMALNLAVFTSKVSQVASPLQSIARYVLVLFPGFIVIGDWLSRQPRNRRHGLLFASALVMGVFSMLYVLAVFIG